MAVECTIAESPLGVQNARHTAAAVIGLLSAQEGAWTGVAHERCDGAVDAASSWAPESSAGRLSRNGVHSGLSLLNVCTLLGLLSH